MSYLAPAPNSIPDSTRCYAARRVGRHEISDDNVAGLYDRLATGKWKDVWAWMVDI